MTKKQAVARFEENVLPGIVKHYEADGVPDWPARREAWNNWTDALHENGEITRRQYETWTHHRCCKP